MIKRALLVLVPALIFGSVCLLVLRTYRLELVYTITLNATLQKAPDSYPAVNIEQAFEEALATSKDAGTDQQFLAHLLKLSMRLEKVQFLSAGQIEELLDDLEPLSP